MRPEGPEHSLEQRFATVATAARFAVPRAYGIRGQL
jgi:hypothetical protein